MIGLQQKFSSELQNADDAQKAIQLALGRQQVRECKNHAAHDVVPT